MPFFHKISVFHVNLCVSDQSIFSEVIPDFAYQIHNLHDLYFDGGGTW